MIGEYVKKKKNRLNALCVGFFNGFMGVSALSGEKERRGAAELVQCGVGGCNRD